MSKEQVLVPVEERQVDFYGDEITAAIVEVDGHFQIYVPMRPIADYLGLSWPGQRERTNRDLVLSKEVRFVRVTRTNLGGNPNLMCLPLELLPGWLFGIQASRVKSELQDKVIRYQRECFKILWRVFQADALTVADLAGLETNYTSSATELPSTSLVQIREVALAVVQLAEQQIALEQKLEHKIGDALHSAQSAHDRLDKASQVFKLLRKRLGVFEEKVSPPSLISDEQATQVALAVKALAEKLTQKDKSKNHYQSIYQELYRRFGISSYKRIQTEQLEVD